MKFLIVILAIVTLAYAEYKVKSIAEVSAIEEECIKEVSLNEEQIKEVKAYEFPDEEPVRKYLLCSVKKLGVFTEEGGYIPENFAKQFKMDLDEAEVLAIAKECADKNEQGSSADVWVYRGNKCLDASKIGEQVKANLKKAQAEAQKQ